VTQTRLEAPGADRPSSELKAQQVGPAVRVLCGVMGVLIAGTGLVIAAGGTSHRLEALLILGAFAVPFILLAVFGIRAPVVDPAAYQRFLELADPTKPLPDSVFRLPGDDPPARSPYDGDGTRREAGSRERGST
jgi:hypothetical protein